MTSICLEITLIVLAGGLAANQALPPRAIYEIASRTATAFSERDARS